MDEWIEADRIQAEITIDQQLTVKRMKIIDLENEIKQLKRELYIKKCRIDDLTGQLDLFEDSTTG